MRKGIFIFLVLCMMFSFSSCSGREDYKEVYRRQGIQALDEENYQGAIDAFLKALSESRGIVRAKDYDINYYLGYAYYLNGDYNDAISVFDSIVSLKPKDTDAYYYRALSKLKLGDLNSAEEDFLKVTEAEPGNYDTYIDIYFCLCDAGFEDAGRNYLKATLEGAQSLSDYDKGRICYYLKDYSNARVYLEKGKDMSDPDTILILGKTYEAIDDYNYASTLYNTYLSEKGNNAAVYNQLGVCRLKREDYPAALSAFTSGLNLDDAEWEQELLYNEAIAYEYMLDFSTAKEKIAAYLEKYPKDDAARRELEFLSTR